MMTIVQWSLDITWAFSTFTPPHFRLLWTCKTPHGDLHAMVSESGVLMCSLLIWISRGMPPNNHHCSKKM